jgi:hypothetical protein
MPPAPSTDPFTCGVCDKDLPAGIERYLIPGDPVCRGCVVESIVPMFHDAVEFEAKYPVKFGPEGLFIDDFAELFDKDFLARFYNVQAQYRIPPAQRVYCYHLFKKDGAPSKGCKGKEILALQGDALDEARQVRAKLE